MYSVRAGRKVSLRPLSVLHWVKKRNKGFPPPNGLTLTLTALNDAVLMDFDEKTVLVHIHATYAFISLHNFCDLYFSFHQIILSIFNYKLTRPITKASW